MAKKSKAKHHAEDVEEHEDEAAAPAVESTPEPAAPAPAESPKAEGRDDMTAEELHRRQNAYRGIT
jgi:hypothetical protein